MVAELVGSSQALFAGARLKGPLPISIKSVWSVISIKLYSKKSFPFLPGHCLAKKVRINGESPRRKWKGELDA